MATALHPSRNGSNTHNTLYPGRAFMTEVDFQDKRYSSSQRADTISATERSGWDNFPNGNDGSLRPRDAVIPTRGAEQRTNQENLQLFQQPQSRSSATSADIQSLVSQSQSISQEPSRNTLSYALPSGSRRVVERYSLEDNSQRAPSGTSTNTVPLPTNNDTRNTITLSPVSRSAPLPVGARRSISPSPGIGANGRNTNNDYPIMPLSASPSYNPPVAPKPRASAQQPKYITPPTTFTPIQAGYSPRPPQQQEEVCVECAMRDEDMADVDVTSPGVWERESDAEYEELKRREEEDAANGLVTIDDPNRPRARGGRLTEQNLKLWLSVNPREPSSRQQTLRTYIKSQKTLLEAEALARARAIQEAKQLESRMRDTYSQLRRSAYDLGNTATPTDDFGGLRIRPPISPTTPIHDVHARSHSREITLLESGMIVEHVNVRKEEREARERKRKEDRARKSSRGSTMDVTSIISNNSLAHTDGGLGLRPSSPFHHSARPISVLTAPVDRRTDIPRTYSQASLSDVHSLLSASPRRKKFIGFKNFSAGWRSQESLAPSGIQSGSMIDMHLALDREARNLGTSFADPAHQSPVWPRATKEPERSEKRVDGSPKKKKKGLAKIWGIVTGRQLNAARSEVSQSSDRNEDDSPLAPPPPLSYLVDRGPSELRIASNRPGSNPSLPSLIPSKIFGNGLASPVLSSSTGPSSLFSSPASSSRISGPDAEVIEALNNAPEDKESYLRDNTNGKNQLVTPKTVHPVISEPDIRRRSSRPDSPVPPLPDVKNLVPLISRDKSLPPLPPEAMSPSSSINAGDARPHTFFAYDPCHLPLNSNSPVDFIPPNAPFRNIDTRRQSFGGVSSRPTITINTMPINGRKSGSPVASHYDDFGHSRRSLGPGPLDSFKDTIPGQQPAKRKSKFGLASLLGKKSTTSKEEYADSSTLQFPLMHRSGSDGQEDAVYNGYLTPTSSRYSALGSGVPQSRLSITSRKVLEERVAQDPNFVAYRYPSNDHRLDLFR